jgi:hypothetical protein
VSLQGAGKPQGDTKPGERLPRILKNQRAKNTRSEQQNFSASCEAVLHPGRFLG